MKYVGFLTNGRLAMVFNSEEEAYKAFHAGLGLVGKYMGDGEVEVLCATSNFPKNNRQGRYLYTSQTLNDRLEVTHPNNFLVKMIKDRIYILLPMSLNFSPISNI